METIEESVSVDLLSNHLKGKAYPWVLYWHGRQYRITSTGMHHKERIGSTLFHIFSVTDGVNFFKLRFDTETLEWQLLNVEASV